MKNSGYTKRFFLIILVLLAFVSAYFLYKKVTVSKEHLFTIFTEAPYQTLMNSEVSAFKNSRYKESKFKIEVLSEPAAILEYDHHPISVLIIPRQLTNKELEDIKAFRAPIHQHLFAVEDKHGGRKEIYLIHDNTLMGVEEDFTKFLLSAEGQEVVKKQNFLPIPKNAF